MSTRTSTAAPPPYSSSGSSRAAQDDPKTAFYVIAHDFLTPAGKKMTFAGVYALLKLEDYKRAC